MTDDELTLNTPTTHSHSLELRARLSHKPPGAGSAAVHPARFSAATVVLQRPAHKESSPAHVRRVRAPLLPGGSWIAAGTYTSRVRIHSLTCVRLSRGPSSRAVGHRRSPRSLAGRRDAGTVPQRRQQYRARSRGYQHRLRQGQPAPVPALCALLGCLFTSVQWLICPRPRHTDEVCARNLSRRGCALLPTALPQECCRHPAQEVGSAVVCQCVQHS